MRILFAALFLVYVSIGASVARWDDDDEDYDDEDDYGNEYDGEDGYDPMDPEGMFASEPEEALDVPKLMARIAIRRNLVDYNSEFQHIKVMEAPFFGNILTLDGDLMLTVRRGPLAGVLRAHADASHVSPAGARRVPLPRDDDARLARLLAAGQARGRDWRRRRRRRFPGAQASQRGDCDAD